jgi:O-antigen/teichoic acid export membrane protein
VLSIAYVRTPVFVLDAIRGAADVGVYGVAQRLTEPLAIVPAALMAAAFPAISRDAGRADTRVLTHTVKLLALAGAGVLVAGVLLGPAAIDALYGSQFPNAGVALQLLAAATLPVFVNYALTHGLIARGRPDLNLILNAVIFAFNLAICWTLAPRYGVAGAAAAILASEILLLALCSVALRRGPAGAIDAAGAS